MIKVTGAIVSGSKGGDMREDLPTEARRASGRRRRFQVIGVLAVVAIAVTVIVGISTSGSRSGAYTGATLTCAAFPGNTVLTLKEVPTDLAINVLWVGDPDGLVSEISQDHWMSNSTNVWGTQTPYRFGFGLVSVTVSQTVGTDEWSISAACS